MQSVCLQIFPVLILAVIQKCERPVSPKNGDVVSRRRNQELFNVGEKIWFKCDEGFDLVGKKDFACQGDESWKPRSFPSCVSKSRLCLITQQVLLYVFCL